MGSSQVMAKWVAIVHLIDSGKALKMPQNKFVCRVFRIF